MGERVKGTLTNVALEKQSSLLLFGGEMLLYFCHWKWMLSKVLDVDVRGKKMN